MFALVSPLCRDGSVTGSCMEVFPVRLTEILTSQDQIDRDERTQLATPSFVMCLRDGTRSGKPGSQGLSMILITPGFSSGVLVKARLKQIKIWKIWHLVKITHVVSMQHFPPLFSSPFILDTFSFVKNSWMFYWLLISNSFPHRRSSILETFLSQVEVFRSW